MRTSRRQALFLLVGLAATGLALAAYLFGAFDDPERQTIDARFSIRGDERPRNVVIVAIDDASIDRLGAWPFRRSIHGDVIDRLRKDGAKLIAYDVEFVQPTEAEEDLALFDAVGRARGKIVLGTSEVGPGGSTNVLGGDANLQQVGASVGDTQLPNDRYAVLRRMPYSVLGLKSLALVTAEKALHRSIRRSELGGNTAWIDYAGPPGTIRAVPFWRVLRGKFALGTFRDKVVVVGASASSLQDLHATPTSGSGLMSGVEVQANEISTAIRDFPLKGASGYLNVVLIVLLGSIPALLGASRPPTIVAAGSVGAAALYTVAAQLAFNRGVILAFVAPLASLGVSFIGALATHYTVAAFERERVREVFSRFVPEPVVDQVLARTGSDLRLGGREYVVTVMFTDLRGFTASAENMPAERVIAMLNDYLGEMSDAILAHGGTLISYMGDGIMAVFGAPIEQDDHAERAICAAREMLSERLPRFNARLREQRLGSGYKMGIGLNTGPVMSGNVGHTRRLEYTAVGDTVNTAARLEGMTKGTPYSLFVAESTYDLLATTDGVVYVDEVEIRGRQQRLKIWGMVAPSESQPETGAEQPASAQVEPA
jgi:adenylate cyclase